MVAFIQFSLVSLVEGGAASAQRGLCYVQPMRSAAWQRLWLLLKSLPLNAIASMLTLVFAPLLSRPFDWDIVTILIVIGGGLATGLAITFTEQTGLWRRHINVKPKDRR